MQRFGFSDQPVSDLWYAPHSTGIAWDSLMACGVPGGGTPGYVWFGVRLNVRFSRRTGGFLETRRVDQTDTEADGSSANADMRFSLPATLVASLILAASAQARGLPSTVGFSAPMLDGGWVV